MHFKSPEVLPKLNKNILSRIINKKSGSQFGFHFQALDTLWRQEVRPRKSSCMAEK